MKFLLNFKYTTSPTFMEKKKANSEADVTEARKEP